MSSASSAAFTRRWPLFGLATLLLIIAASAAIWAGTTPAGAQDGYEPDQQVIADVWEYARETDNGFDHVLRWVRALKTLGAIEDMTAAEAQGYADQHLPERWNPVVAELTALENAPGDYEPDQDVIADVWDYARETDHGFDHVLRWMRALKTLGAIEDMTAAEAQGYADQFLPERWDPVVAELEKLEAAATPNRAPVVNTQAENYRDFTGTNNAPRGVLVSKPFHGVFSDPDGDALTYAVSVPDDQRHFVELLQAVRDEDVPTRADRPREVGLLTRVWFRAEEAADWKALNPPLMHCPVVAATLTATDPEGLSVSLDGPFLIRWECYPEVVSATASREAIELTFDWAVEADPAPTPEQFTVNVVNGDGSEGSVAVNSVLVNGKVVRLELGSELAEGQTVTVDYDYDYRTPLRLAGGDDNTRSPGFTGQAVALDVSGPAFVAAKVSGATLKVTFNEELDAASTPSGSAFTVAARLGGGEARSIAGTGTASVDGAVVTVGLAEAVHGGHTVAVAYAPPEDNPVHDLAGNPAAAFSGEDVTNKTPAIDPGAPRMALISATIKGATLTLAFNNDVHLDWNTRSVPDASRFAVTVNGETVSLAATRPVSVSTSTVILTLNQAVSASDTVTVSYTADWWDSIHSFGHRCCGYLYADNLTNHPVTNIMSDGRAPTLSAAAVEGAGHLVSVVDSKGAVVTLTFDEQLDPNAEPAPDAFSVTVNGVPVSFRPYSWANGGRPVPALWDAVPVWINGHSVMLTLAGKVAVGHEVAVRYQQPQSGAKLQDLAGNPVAAFDATEVENRTRTSPPLIADAWSYAQETDSGYDHVLRWMRVFKTLSVLNDMTAAEAHQHANQHQPARWEPVAAELEKLENAPDDYQPDPQLVDDVRGYAQETGKGFWHVLRWMRTLQAFGALADMTSAEAHEYANQHQAARWDPVAAELAAKEAATAEPEASVPVAPANFAVSSTVGTLDIAATWDALEGATSYRLRWQQAGGEFEPDDEITVTDTEATITVSSYGQWEIRLQACNDAGCGPEASQTVELSSLHPPANFQVSAQLGQLDLWAQWDAVAGATSYKLRWRQGDGELEPANAITVTDTSATITVSGYGEWEVRLQACDDARCVPEEGGPADDAPTVRLSLEPGPEGQSQVQAPAQSRSRAQSRSLSTTRNQAADASSYTLGWRRAGADPETLEVFQPDAGQQSRANGGPSGAVSPRANDQTGATPPRLERGEIDGDTMTFYFSEALDEAAVGSRFRVTLDWGSGWVNFTAHPTRVEVRGNQVVVYGLSYKGWPGWERALAGHRVTVYYYKDDRVVPAEERLQDLDGNEVATPHRSLGGHFPATRTIWLSNLTAPPVVQRAAVHPNWLTLTFNKKLDGNSVPAAGAFTVTVNGSAASLASVEPVAVSGETVTLLLAAPLVSTDLVTVSYAQPSVKPLRGPDGAVKSFPSQSVTNLVGVTPAVSEVAITSTPADGEAYAPGETIRVKATFTEAMNVTGAPRLRIKLAPSYGEKWADYESGSGSAELTFAYTVVEPDRSTRGVAVLGDTLDLNGGAIRSVSTQQDAHLWYAGLDHDADHMVDWHRSAPGVPWVTEVATSSDPGDDSTYALGDTIEVTATFSEVVDVDTTGGTPRLKARMAPYLWWLNQGLSPLGTDHAERWADYAGGSGTTTLTFNYTVLGENRSTQGVAVLGNGLELNGGTIRSKAAPPTDAHLRYGGLWHDRDHQVDGKIPSLLTVAVAGTKVALTYDEALDENSVPPASAFTVQRTPQGGVAETVSLSGTPDIAAGAVILTLADPVVDTDSDVKVSYAKPTAADSRLRDKAGNEVAGFTSQAADPTDTTRPRLVRGEIDGDTMTVYFSEALDEDLAGNGDYFRITMDHQSNSPNYDQCLPGDYSFTTEPRRVYVNGNTAVVVGLNDYGRRAIVDWVIIDLHYIADVTVAKRLRDLAGNPVSTPNYAAYHPGQNGWSTRSIKLENVTWLPSPERATVIGDQLTLTFDAPLDGGWRPAASAFTVTVNGSAVSLADANAVAVSGHNVTLTLATAVAAGDDVTVTYEKAGQQLAAEREVRIRRELLRRTREQLHRGVQGNRGDHLGRRRRRHLRPGRRDPRPADLQRGGESDRQAGPEDQDGPGLRRELGAVRERQRHEQPDLRLHGGGAEHLTAGHRGAGEHAGAEIRCDPVRVLRGSGLPGTWGAGPRREPQGGLAALTYVGKGGAQGRIVRRHHREPALNGGGL